MMTSKRLRLILIALLGILFLGLISGTYEANKLLENQAAKLVTLKAKNEALTSEQQGLVKAKKDIKTYAKLETIAKSVVPQDKDQAEAVREIVNIAEANGISLATISFPASSLGSIIPQASSSVSSTTKSTVSFSQLQAVKNINGVYLLQISVVSDSNKPVAYDKFISFLSALENNRRTAQVSTISIQPNLANRNLLTFSLSLNEYIKP